ncbi:sugar-binding transcriptional regulator [Agrobacterium rhizogenes]|nr:sugar-binding transcriptional regulator [Rhizobium rhizogenes]NTH87311.1 sugar-binding transcriptional regulator [Rhizobium rhizogenes]
MGFRARNRRMRRTKDEPNEDNWEPPESFAGGREQLLARVAWLYHVEGLTQQEVASELGMHRLKVNRLLARARQDGIVQVSIRSPYVSSPLLEKELVAKFDLRKAVVVPAPVRPDSTPEAVGAGIGQYLNARLSDQMSLGIISGRTFHAALSALEARAIPGLSIVSMIGGLTVKAAMRPYEVAHQLAQIYQAECYYMPAPTYAESKKARDEFLAQSLVQEIMRRAAAVDIAIIGVGRLTEDGVIRAYDLLQEEEMDSLVKAGAVGSFVGWFINKDGTLVDHALNDRVIGLPLDRLKDVPEVVLCGGGIGKAQALAAVLRAGYADVLITDEAAARRLVSNDF